MKIDWHEYDGKQHVLAWLLLEGMAAKKMEKFGNFDASALDVVLSVNGIELDLISCMDNLQNQLTAIEDEGKKEGINNAFEMMQDSLTEHLEALIHNAKHQLEKDLLKQKMVK